MNKIKSYNKTQLIGLIGGIVAFVLLYFVAPLEGLSLEGRGVLATLALVGILWMTEAVDAGIAGLLPLIIFPLTNCMSASATAAAYGSNTVFMFFGGFAIALALEKWGLHNRIALTIINFIGTSMNRLIVGLLISSAFISMWVSNTATALMLLPIATAIGSKMGELIRIDHPDNEKDCLNFKKATILAIGFGATIGGSLTLIGTPTNISLQGFAQSLLGIDIAFAPFLGFEFPIAIAQLLITYVVLTKIFFKVSVKEVDGGKEYIENELKSLGKLSFEEKTVLVVFLITVFFWMTNTFIWSKMISGLSETIISIIACVVLYLLPSKNVSGRILNADSIKKMPWGVILMLMGGLAFASGFSKTDLAQWIGNQLLTFSGSSEVVIIVVVAIFSLLVTQLAPNTATGTIMIPIACSLAQAVGMNPLVLMATAALGCGFAFTFPCGTPVMGILYGTGEFNMGELIKTGILVVLVTLVAIVFCVLVTLPIFFTV